KARLLAAPLPGGAAVVRPEEGAVLGLDHRVDAAAVGGGGGPAGSPEDAARQAGIAADLRPRIAAVGGAPEPRVRAAARHAPRHALGLPHPPHETAPVVGV